MQIIKDIFNFFTGRKDIFLKYLWVIIFSLILLFFISYYYRKQLKSLFNPKELDRELEVNRIVNILYGGISEKGDRLLSLYLTSYEPVTRRMGIIYIPLNTTLLSVDQMNKKTVAEIYQKHSIKGLKESINYFLKTEVPFYIFFNKSSFIKCIDIIGGINVNVVRPIKYINKKKGEYFFIKKGYQLFLGKKIYEYLSYNKDSVEDIGRVFRQSQFIKALVEKVQTEKPVLIHESIIKFIHGKAMITNLKVSDIGKILNILSEIKNYDIIFDKLPGHKSVENKKRIYIPNAVKALNMMPQSYHDILLANKKNPNITVQILNGTNISGLASQLRDRLQPYFDIDVLEVGDVDKKKKGNGYKITYIYDRKNNFRSAQRIKEILGLGKIETKKGEDSFVDVTIVIGEDYIIKN